VLWSNCLELQRGFGIYDYDYFQLGGYAYLGLCWVGLGKARQPSVVGIDLHLLNAYALWDFFCFRLRRPTARCAQFPLS
jgi:hypothetical protein